MTYIKNEKGREIRLEDISKEEEKKVLEFLNRSNAEELAKGIEIIEVRDVGLRIAEMIVKERERLQGFTSLKQVMDIQGIGSKRLCQSQYLQKRLSMREVTSSYSCWRTPTTLVTLHIYSQSSNL